MADARFADLHCKFEKEPDTMTADEEAEYHEERRQRTAGTHTWGGWTAAKFTSALATTRLFSGLAGYDDAKHFHSVFGSRRLVGCIPICAKVLTMGNHLEKLKTQLLLKQNARAQRPTPASSADRLTNANGCDGPCRIGVVIVCVTDAERTGYATRADWKATFPTEGGRPGVDVYELPFEDGTVPVNQNTTIERFNLCLGHIASCVNGSVYYEERQSADEYERLGRRIACVFSPDGQGRVWTVVVCYLLRYHRAELSRRTSALAAPAPLSSHVAPSLLFCDSGSERAGMAQRAARMKQAIDAASAILVEGGRPPASPSPAQQLFVENYYRMLESEAEGAAAAEGAPS